MQVTFTKVDGKRYFITISREHGPALVPRFAPGYDDLMPHDLAHYLVEEQFGIELGVWGQLAAGGGGIFKPAPSDDTGRYRRSAARIAAVGRDDMVRSEQLVVLSMTEWERRIGRNKQQTQPFVVEVEPDKRQAAIRRLSDVAEQWQALEHGASLTFDWPKELTFNASSSRRGRRRTRRTVSGHRSSAGSRR